MPTEYHDIQEGVTNYVYLGTIIFLLMAVLFIVFVSISLQRRKRLTNEKRELFNQYQQEILRTQLEIQEQTLKTISQEIHDNIGQMLSLAKLNLALAQNDIGVNANDGVTTRLADSKQLVSKAIQDLRDLSRSLNTDYVSEMGIQRALEYELEMIDKTGVISAKLETEGTVRRPEKQQELILFRIIQESLNNIIRHAEATKIMVYITYAPGSLKISIQDNGKGVDLGPLNTIQTNVGLGIRNMHSRAKLINAEFRMSSTIGVGTTITIELPNE